MPPQPIAIDRHCPAKDRQAAGRAPSEFVALKQIANERRIDLTDYFPDIRLESTLHNVGKRNNILLNELLLRSKGRLQLGLDLAGGVAVTLEVDPRVAAKNPYDVEKEKLGKAIDIISSRVNVSCSRICSRLLPKSMLDANSTRASGVGYVTWL